MRKTTVLLNASQARDFRVERVGESKAGYEPSECRYSEP
jgi:hypothetical protein